MLRYSVTVVVVVQNQNLRKIPHPLQKRGNVRIPYLGITIINQNYIHEGINIRLNRGTLATVQFRIFCLPV
jgi:hypothetical protein